MFRGPARRFSNRSRFVTEMFHQFDLNQRHMNHIFYYLHKFLRAPRIKGLILVDDLFVRNLDIQSFMCGPPMKFLKYHLITFH